MRMVDLIKKKRDGHELSETELSFMIEGYVQGSIPDYQIAAWAMAVYFQGMSSLERALLTKAMSHSGEQVNLAEIGGVKVDKHSTGGVGDTTTLVLAPLVASVGVPVAKMSGRGLGHTGGTIDKLESIPGFHSELSKEKFLALVNQNKLAIIGQTKNITPADGKLYSLRDVTATVDSIPLIASSIMSKKIAAGADALVLDVKTGQGAFMQELNDAKELAQAMVEIGTHVGMKTVAVISNMNEPLGYMIGNALEVKEAIATLQGKGPKDLEELCLTLGSYMVLLAKRAETISEARALLKNAITSGKALHKFQTFIQTQGGDPSVIEDPAKLPISTYQISVPATKTGYVTKIAAAEIGMAAMILGAGRATKDAIIDLSVGVELKKKIGDLVHKGEPLALLHCNQEQPTEAFNLISASISISPQKTEKQPLIYEHIL